MELAWYTSDSADECNHDQEVDLDRIGNPGGASWAYVAPDGRPGHKPWNCEVLDRWLYEDAETLAAGEADDEAGAKAAVTAWVAARS